MSRMKVRVSNFELLYSAPPRDKGGNDDVPDMGSVKDEEF